MRSESKSNHRRIQILSSANPNPIIGESKSIIGESKSNHRWIQIHHRRIQIHHRRIQIQSSANANPSSANPNPIIGESKSIIGESKSNHRWIQIHHRRIQIHHRRIQILSSVNPNSVIDEFKSCHQMLNYELLTLAKNFSCLLSKTPVTLQWFNSQAVAHTYLPDPFAAWKNIYTIFSKNSTVFLNNCCPPPWCLNTSITVITFQWYGKHYISIPLTFSKKWFSKELPCWHTDFIDPVIWYFGTGWKINYQEYLWLALCGFTIYSK